LSKLLEGAMLFRITAEIRRIWSPVTTLSREGEHADLYVAGILYRWVLVGADENPQNRVEAVGKAASEAVGGKLIGAWYAFGDYDVVIIADLPNPEAMAAIAIALGAGGALKSAKTTVLMSGAEAVTAIAKANDVAKVYRPARWRPLATPDRAPRIRLPDDLSGSLKYLDDAELQRLQDAVNAEIERRDPVRGKKERDQRSSSTEASAQIPAGKVNLIQASFKAGLTPAAIARTLGIPSALVRRALKSKAIRPTVDPSAVAVAAKARFG
jgi:uncharacterized protein with GYD domain